MDTNWQHLLLATAPLVMWVCCRCQPETLSKAPPLPSPAQAERGGVQRRPGQNAPPTITERQPISLLGTLGLEDCESVTDDDIRRAHRKLVREYHPDRLAAARKSSEEIAAATARFADIQSAYEILTGEDQSIMEVGGPPLNHATSEADERLQRAAQETASGCSWTAGDSLQLKGEILRVRRHGKQLTFCRMRILDEMGQTSAQCCSVADHARASVELVFHSKNFHHELSAHPFPAAKKSVQAGDTITIKGVWEHNSNAPSNDELCRLRVSEWIRLDIENAAVETAVERLQREGRRRTGKAAMAGWVMCPICAAQRLRAGRRYNRGDGLRQHMTKTHAKQRDEFVQEQLHRQCTPSLHPSFDVVAVEAETIKEQWYIEMASKAEALGVQSRRSAGSAGMREGADRARGMSYVGSELALAEEPGSAGEKLRHPALVAARDGDYEKLVSLLCSGWKVYHPGSLDRHGASALDWAAGGGHLQVCASFSVPSRCAQNNLKWPPFTTNFDSMDQVVELLAPAAVGVLSSRRDGRGPAHWAARHGHTAVLSRLLGWEGAPFGTANTRTTNGTTMLMLACFGGHVETAKALLLAGAQLHDRNAWDCDVVRPGDLDAGVN